MNTQLKDEIFKNLDIHLSKDNFKFRKRSQEWRKVVAEGEVFKIHLNVGKIMINPSVWYYSDRLAFLWRDSGLDLSDISSEIAQFGQMLTVLSGHLYDGATVGISDVIYSDLIGLGFPYLERLRDNGEVARMLHSTNFKDWPTFTRDRRAYSLLLTLAESGQVQQAFSLVPSLEADLQSALSVRPPFPDFLRWFTRKYESNSV
jgi:hypothetical protein